MIDHLDQYIIHILLLLKYVSSAAKNNLENTNNKRLTYDVKVYYCKHKKFVINIIIYNKFWQTFTNNYAGLYIYI